MGDWYQSYVAPDIQPSEVQGASSKTVQFLLERGIIREEMSDCVLGSELGYPPGPNAESILADGKNAGFAGVRELWTNGVDLEAGSKLYMLAETLSDDFECICPNCDARHSSEFFYEICLEKLAEWEQGHEADSVGCPECNSQSIATAWRTDPDSFVAANFAITFWNWSVIDEKFISEMQSLLGSRLVKLESKL
jgi:hypothetical protein